MFSKRKYVDEGDSRQTGFKRPQLDSGQPPPFPVVRLRGLPFDCSEANVIDFFHGLNILDILFVRKGGRFTGEAYCVLAYPLQVEFALQRNRQNLGRRYIEVFRSTRQEYYSSVAQDISDSRGGSPRRSAARARSSDDGKDNVEHTGVLRMRGLPYSAGKDDIMDFFKDYDVSEDCVRIVLNSEGRSTGEAYVAFGSPEVSKSAMGRDRMTMGTRYIELFPSTPEEMDEATSKGQ